MATVSSISSSVQNIKFTSIADMPELQLWLDASDYTTTKTYSISTVDDWSWSFNGSNQLFTAPNTDGVFDFGTGDFTIEAWIKLTSNLSTYGKTIIDSRPDNTNGSFWSLGVGLDREIGISIDPTSIGSVSSKSKINSNTWYHFAFCRLNGTIKVFVNGQLETTEVRAGLANSHTRILIGANAYRGHAPQTYWGGLISNLRVLKGTPLYGDNFIPSPLSLPATTQTSVLLFQQNNTPKDWSNKNLPLTPYNNPLPVSPEGTTVTHFVSAWLDKSNFSLSATQMIVSNQAIMLSSSVNGLNCLNFDGNQQFLVLNNPIYTNVNYSQFFVFKRETNGIVSTSLGNITPQTNYSFLWYNNNQLYSYTLPTNLHKGTNSIGTSGVHIVSTLQSADEKYVNFFVDGNKKTVTLGGAQGTQSATANNIGRSQSVAEVYLHDGIFAELIQANFEAHPYEISLVTEKLTNKWKIPREVPFVRSTPEISVASISSLNTTFGTWVMEPTAYKVQWQSSVDGNNWNNLASQTGTFLTLNSTHSNKHIRTQIIAENNIGSSSFSYSNVLTLTTTSINPIPVVSFADPDLERSIVVSTPGSWSSTLPITSINYQWFYNLNGGSWNLMNFATASADAINLPNASIKSVVTANTTINAVSVESVPIITTNVNQRATALLINAEQGNTSNGNNKTVSDQSSLANTLTRGGTPVMNQLSPFQNQGGSCYFDGSSDYFSLPGTCLNFGTGDFTIEFWCSTTTSGTSNSANRRIISKSNNSSTGVQIKINPVSTYGPIGGISWNVDTQFNAIAIPPINDGIWHHVVFSRKNGVLSSYLDGTKCGSIADTTNYTNTSTTYIGSKTTGDGFFLGYLSNLRIINGPAIYPDESLIVPTSSLTPVSNTTLLVSFEPLGGGIVDVTGKHSLIYTEGNSGYNINGKFGKGIVLNGSPDYILIPSNTSFDFGTGDFTIECWANFSTLGTNRTLIDRWTSGSGWQLYWRATGQSITFYVNSTVVLQDPSPSTITTGVFYHIAVVRHFNVVKLYINGEEKDSSVSNTNLTYTRPVTLGSQYSSSTNYFSGILDDVRICKAARYKENFAVPSQPLALN